MTAPDSFDDIGSKLRGEISSERELGLRAALRRNKEQLFESLEAPKAPARRRGGLVLSPLFAVAAVGAAIWIHGRPVLTAAPHAVSASAGVEQPAGSATWNRQADPLFERVALHEGTLALRTRQGGPKLRVVVPDGELEDIGTAFRVTVSEGRTVSIEVTEGLVVFHRHDAADVRLPAGATWTAPPVSGALTTNQAPAAPEASSHGIASPQPRSPSSPATKTADTGEDAAYLRVVALVRENRRDEARVAAQEYLRRFPNGFRRVEVERLAR